jgi:hypothetical protein
MPHPKVGHPVLALSATSFARPAPLPPAVVIDTEALSASCRSMDADPSGADHAGWTRALRAPAP